MTLLIPSPGGHMIDIDNVSDAELGAIFRDQIKARIAERVQAATPAVVAQRAKQEAEEVAHVAERQEERRSQIIPGFMVGTHLVPDLDLTEVTDLNEAPSAKQRSVYNKALYRLKEDLLDAETTTYAVLLDTHERLSSTIASPKAKKAKKKTKAILAETDTKAAALAEILGVSVKAARKLVTA